LKPVCRVGVPAVRAIECDSPFDRTRRQIVSANPGTSRCLECLPAQIDQPHEGVKSMALKKSDLYSSLWASCDELRGGMDASQYKDYVLFMLFIKYVSDKYGNSEDFAPPVVIPK